MALGSLIMALVLAVSLIPNGWGAANASPIQDNIKIAQTGGLPKMNSHPEVRVIEIDDPQSISARSEPHTHSAHFPQGDNSAQRVSLDELNSRLDGIKVPNLPEGFTLTDSRMYGRDLAEHAYYNPETKLRITISEHKGPMLRAIKRGHYKRVSVKGYPGYLITGTWVVFIQDGNSEEYWDPDAGRLLLFRMGERTYRVAVAVNPVSKGFTDEDLMAVAESLVPYEGEGS